MRKLLDIPDSEVDRLKDEAKKNGLSFKKYLEHKILETKSDTVYDCPQCGESFENSNACRIHIKDHKKIRVGGGSYQNQPKSGHAPNCPCYSCN